MILFASNAIIRERTDGTNETIYSPIQYSPLILRSSRAFNLYLGNGVDIGTKLETFDTDVQYDWVHRIFLWLQFSEGVIRIANASHVQTTYDFSIRTDPFMSDIVMNVQKSVLVFPILGPKPRIEQCNYDGTDQHVLFAGKPTLQLSIDYHSKRYYFFNLANNSLHSIDFEGNNEIFYVKSSDFSDIEHFDVYNNDFYYMRYGSVYKLLELHHNFDFSDLKSKIQVFSSNKYTLKGGYFLSMILLKHHHKYPNRCMQAYCSHLCLPIGQTFRCVCPKGYHLSDNTKCIITSNVSTDNQTIDNQTIGNVTCGRCFSQLVSQWWSMFI